MWIETEGGVVEARQVIGLEVVEVKECKGSPYYRSVKGAQVVLLLENGSERRSRVFEDYGLVRGASAARAWLVEHREIVEQARNPTLLAVWHEDAEGE